VTRDGIRNDLIQLLKDAKEDWDDSIVITDDTGLFFNLGFESIDAVGLGSALESHFGKTLPFPEFMARAKEEHLKDITVGRLVDFLILEVGQGKVA